MLNSQDKLRKLFEFPIDSINQRDGLKITFSNQDWVLCRPSGTEPVIQFMPNLPPLNPQNIMFNTLKNIYLKCYQNDPFNFNKRAMGHPFL